MDRDRSFWVSMTAASERLSGPALPETSTAGNSPPLPNREGRNVRREIVDAADTADHRPGPRGPPARVRWAYYRTRHQDEKPTSVIRYAQSADCRIRPTRRRKFGTDRSASSRCSMRATVSSPWRTMYTTPPGRSAPRRGRRAAVRGLDALSKRHEGKLRLHPGSELFARRRLASHAEARKAIFSYVEGWYNPVRLHSPLAIAPHGFREGEHPGAQWCPQRPKPQNANVGASQSRR
jgi:hypothetical protein